MKIMKKMKFLPVVLFVMVVIIVIIIYDNNYKRINIQRSNDAWRIYDTSVENIKEKMEIITESNEDFDWWQLKPIKNVDSEYQKTLNWLVANVRTCYFSYIDDSESYTNLYQLKNYKNKKYITKKELKQLNKSEFVEMNKKSCLINFADVDKHLISTDDNLKNKVYNVTNDISKFKTNNLFLSETATYNELLMRKILEIHLIEDVSEYLFNEYNRLK